MITQQNPKNSPPLISRWMIWCRWRYCSPIRICRVYLEATWGCEIILHLGGATTCSLNLPPNLERRDIIEPKQWNQGERLIDENRTTWRAFPLYLPPDTYSKKMLRNLVSREVPRYCTILAWWRLVMSSTSFSSSAIWVVRNVKMARWSYHILICFDSDLLHSH